MRKKLLVISWGLLVVSFAFCFGKSTFAKSNFDIYSDSDFSSPQTKFSSGQTAYIKVETGFLASKTNRLRLLTGDSTQQIGETRSFGQSGTDPYVYTASLALPQEPGIYVLDIKLESDSSSYAVAHTVTVQDEQTEEVWPTVSPSPSAKQALPLLPSLSPTSTVSPTPQEPEAEEQETATTKIINFIKGLVFFPFRLLSPFIKKLLMLRLQSRSASPRPELGTKATLSGVEGLTKMV